MGEEPSTSGSAVSVEARDPEKIRKEIEATRYQLGDTIEALAEKTDVRAQAALGFVVGRRSSWSTRRPDPS
jgi:Protein of unknown function (DUF3618)